MTPTRLVDAINPSLGLDHNASVLVEGGGTIEARLLDALDLRWLNRVGSILPIAAVDLDRRSVCCDIEGDTCVLGGHMDGWDERVGGVPCWSVDDEAVVVSCAVGAAEADSGIDVLADELRRGEVWRAIIGVHGGDFSVGDEDPVGGNEA